MEKLYLGGMGIWGWMEKHRISDRIGLDWIGQDRIGQEKGQNTQGNRETGSPPGKGRESERIMDNGLWKRERERKRKDI
jgi:hypothetical protein